MGEKSRILSVVDDEKSLQLFRIGCKSVGRRILTG